MTKIETEVQPDGVIDDVGWDIYNTWLYSSRDYPFSGAKLSVPMNVQLREEGICDGAGDREAHNMKFKREKQDG